MAAKQKNKQHNTLSKKQIKSQEWQHFHAEFMHTVCKSMRSNKIKCTEQ